ncbi:Replication factor C, subunit RFC4 [Rhodotorula kratochvilovae]
MVKQSVDMNDQSQHYRATVVGGAKGGLAGLAVGGAGAAALQRAGVPAFTKLTLPLKAFAVTSIATASFIISADKAARDYELKKYAVGSGTELERVSHEQQRLEQEAGIAPGQAQKAQRAPVSTKEAVIEWAKENRWTAVGVSWVGSMVASGAYIAATPLSFAQKLVQARMIAQGVTVAALIASAGLTQIPNAQGLSDDDIKREERERGMYNWKTTPQHTKSDAKET